MLNYDELHGGKNEVKFNLRYMLSEHIVKPLYQATEKWPRSPSREPGPAAPASAWPSQATVSSLDLRLQLQHPDESIAAEAQVAAKYLAATQIIRQSNQSN